MMRISKHFSLREFTRSQTARRAGIPVVVNSSSEIFENLCGLCNNVLEPLREIIQAPIIISSGYRPAELNALIGGSPTSQHMLGQAADINAIGITPYDLALQIITAELPFDQLIYEFGEWVHVSWSRDPRGETLTSYRSTTGTHYKAGIVPLASIEGAL